jgi:hypothetical protein
VTQLTAYFNPSPTADPRTRGSVRRASGFVQIAIPLTTRVPSVNTSLQRLGQQTSAQTGSSRLVMEPAYASVPGKLDPTVAGSTMLLLGTAVEIN